MLVYMQMVYSTYTKLRIVHYYSRGHKPYTIAGLLKENDGITVSRFGVAKFLKVYQSTGSIERRSGSGRLSSVTWRIKELVEQRMQEDDESTATQLHQMLLEQDMVISLRTVLRCRTSLGWTFRGSAYCQLIRDANKVKRLHWARQHTEEEFNDVIFTDETTVQLENHRRFCCRKEGQRPKPKPR
jgi:transposase